MPSGWIKLPAEDISLKNGHYQKNAGRLAAPGSICFRGFTPWVFIFFNYLIYKILTCAKSSFQLLT